MSYRIRRALVHDLELLGEIELSAAALFPAGRIPDPDEVTSTSEFADALADDLLFVATRNGTPVGFALCAIANGRLHLGELAVHPDHGRRGVGRRLVQAVIDEAASRRLSGVTLTTFADLPFNGPFYESMGFRAVRESELDSGLRETLAQERARGMTDRIAMLFRSLPLGTA